VFEQNSLRKKSAASAFWVFAWSCTCTVFAQESEMKTWTLRTGEQLEARLMGVSAEMVTLSRERSKVLINGKPYKECIIEKNVQALIVERSLPDKSEAALAREVEKRGRGKPVELPLFFMYYKKPDGWDDRVPVGSLSDDDIAALKPEVEKWWNENAQILAAKKRERENAQAAREQLQRQQAAFVAQQAAIEAQKKEDDSWQWYFIRCGTCGRPADPAKQKVSKGQDPGFHKQRKCHHCGGQMTYTATSR
jgi:hypothetical protein